MKISFIGGGNMGEAILSAVIGKRLAVSKDVTVSDIKSERLDYLKNKYSINVTTNNADAIPGRDVVLFSIKPQTVPEVLPQLKNKLKNGQLVISIIAGTRIAMLRNGLNHSQIIRTMPNTPAQVGEGITGWVATPEVTQAQKDTAKSILGGMGKEIYFPDEKYLDMVTAVSGSGPAYVFLFMEALESAAERIGLPKDAAKALVFQTVLGSTIFAGKSEKSLTDLRRMVTSPGGTTAEALARFEKGGFNELVYEAVLAAFNKSKSLGG